MVTFAQREKLKNLLMAIQATGASFGETLGMVRSLPGGEVLALETWATFLEAGPQVADVLSVLLDVTQSSPRLAEELLLIWFQEHAIDGSLDLSNLSWIRRLPPGIHVHGHLGLNGCAHLGCLPSGMRVDRDLEIGRCGRLTTLPVGLWVGGDLWAETCRSLITLPKAMTVGGDLYLSGCPWDGGVPPGVVVKGRIVR